MISNDKLNVPGANSIHAFVKTMLLCVLSGSAGFATADDTEVFFGNASNSGDTRPNVMFVLDTSGSMGHRDGGSETRLERMKDAVRQMINSELDMNIGLMNYSGKLGGGPVLYPITTLTEVVCDSSDGITDCSGPEVPADNVYEASDSFADVQEEVSTGAISTANTTLDFGLSNGSTTQTGIRFAGINIARGATILEARLEFVATGDHEDESSLTIKMEDVNDAAPFTDSNNDVSDRTFDSMGVPWQPDDWFDQLVYQTPDMAELVQNVVNKGDWCTGNAMGFSISGTGSRSAYSFDGAASGNAAYIPRLIIIQDPATVVAEENCGSAPVEVSASITDDNDDVEQRIGKSGIDLTGLELDLQYHNGSAPEAVGVRFNDINIPQGAQIENAVIEFRVYSKKTGSLSLDISAEDSVDPAAYASNNRLDNNSRNYLAQTVAWNNLPEWDGNLDVETPDLSTLVQALVSNANWDSSDNAVSFVLTPSNGNGRRGFKSRRNNTQTQPRLVVTYTVAGVGTGTTAAPAYSGTTTTTTTGPITVEAREEMLEVIDGLVATGYTPTVDAYYEAARYLRGEPVEYGKTRGTDDNSRREHFRVSHPKSYTGGNVVRPDGCTDNNLTSNSCRDEQITGNPTYISPMVGSCQANHIVLLSDGETNFNSSTSKILSMIGEGACNAVDDNDEVCATDLAEWLLATDHSPDNTGLADMQNIVTHTIAFNLDGDGKDFLESIADAGGGSAHEADTADELLGVFNDIVTNIADLDTGFTAPATTVNQFNRLTHRKDLYFALFKPEDSARWTGNIKRFRLGKDNDGNGEVVIRDIAGNPAVNTSTGFFNSDSRSFWPERDDNGMEVTEADGNIVARGGAANQLRLDGITGIGDRRVYTWLADASTPIVAPIDLTANAQKLHETNLLITDTTLNIAGTNPNVTEQAAYRTSLLQWARGVDVLDSDGDESTTDIRRSLGDPMHSRPVVVNYAAQSADDDPRSLIFISTNEGFLHAFDTANGQEQFAFIPYELLGNLNTFFTDESGFDRPYGLDGALSVWRNDVNNNQVVDSNDSAYLFVGMRRGGSSYYALDITDPNAPKLAWTIKGGAGGTTGFESMGQSWSRLTPVQMYIEGEAEDVLVFGGGYDDNQDRASADAPRSHGSDSTGNAVYIVKATTGELLWSGLGVAGGTKRFDGMNYGFNGHVRTIDINRDGYVDQMYAADAGGQLWRFDIAQYHTDESDDLVYGGIIADFSGALAADHRRFYNEPDVALIEGGGERFLSVSIGSGWRAHPLDEITEDRFYMLRQYAVYERPAGYGKSTDPGYTAITESDLVNVSATASPDVNQYGWYLDFTDAGEKVLGTSVTFDNTVIFSTYVPTAQTAACAAEIGGGRAYVMDVVSGAPVVDLATTLDPESGEPSPALTLEDRSIELNRSGIPPEATVMLSEDSPDTPQILIGGEQLETGATNQTRRTFWSDEGVSGDIVVTESEDEDQ